MTCRIGLLAMLFSIAGCSLDRNPIENAVDGGMRDAGGMDAGMLDGGGLDAPPPDAPLPDVPGLDAGTDTGVDAFVPPFDGGTDAGMPDTGVDAGMRDAGVDAGMPDAGVDAGPPDAGMPDAPPPPRTCDDIYGTLPNYEPCTETTTECTFYLDPSGNTSCSTHCSARGGMCVDGFSEGSPVCSFTTPGFGCANTSMDMVCRCTRIP